MDDRQLCPPPPPPPAPLTQTISNTILDGLKPTKESCIDILGDRRDIVEKIRRIISYVIPSRKKTSQMEIISSGSDGLALANPQAVATETLNEVYERKPDWKWICRINMAHTRAVTQIGPSCGFAALAVVAQLLPPRQPICQDPDSPVSVASRMLNWARTQGFTNWGEMFSTADLLATLTQHCECTAHFASYSAVEPDSRENVALQVIIEHVDRGGLVLVPYDKSPNHEPAQRNGHFAHWCVIVGVVRFWLEHEGEESCLTYVVCRHGASSKHALWNLGDLIRSNAGLQEFGPRRLQQECSFVVSDFKDLKDLRGTFVFVDINKETDRWRSESALFDLIDVFCA